MSRVEATEAQESVVAPAPPNSPVRQLLTWLGLLALVASAILGSNMFALRDRLFGTATPDAAAPAASRVAGAPTQDTVGAAPTSLRSSPWWQDLTSLDGTGTMTSASFTIPSGAIQWRVKWTCDTGHLMVRAPKQVKPVVDGACPGGTDGYSVQKGQMTVQVTADGPWHLQIAQQVDVPLVETPLAAMTAAGTTTVGTGTFYNVDKTGTGKVTIYHQADGNFSARLENFFVSPNVDLELRLSTLEAPHSSQEFSGAPSELVATMDVTAGSVNYTFPGGVDPSRYKSVVVWCVPIKSAYAAATLEPAR